MKPLSTISLLLYTITLFSCDQPNEDHTQVSISIIPEALAEVEALGLQTPVTGRMFVVFSRSDDREPRLQVNVNGVPFWGKDVHDLNDLTHGGLMVTSYPQSGKKITWNSPGARRAGQEGNGRFGKLYLAQQVRTGILGLSGIMNQASLTKPRRSIGKRIMTCMRI